MDDEDLVDCALSGIVPLDGVENIRGKIIRNQALVVANNLSKNEEELPCVIDINTELNEINFLTEKCQKNLAKYTTTTELNINTQEAIEEYISGMETTQQELQEELTFVSKRLASAKDSFNYVLQKHWPQHQGAIRSILKELEEASSAEDEEDKYREVDCESEVAPALILVEALCIVPHPTKVNFFKLAPLI